MTISSTNRKAGPFIGTGLVSTYPFIFKIFQESDILVQQKDTSNVISELILNADYTVALNADQNSAPGGSITLANPLASGFVLAITSQVETLQGLDLVLGGRFDPEDIENELDKLTILDQQLQLILSQAITVPNTDPGVSMSLPAANVRAGMLLMFNGDGSPGVVSPITGTPTTAAAIANSLGGTVQDFINRWRSFESFGAVGDSDGVNSGSGADDTGAIRNAVAWAIANGSFVYATPGKAYRVTGPINVYAAAGSAYWGFGSLGWHTSTILADFQGYDTFVIGSRNGLRTQAPEIRNLRVVYPSGSTQNPVALDIGGPNNLRLRGFSVATCDNTQIRLTTAYNSVADDVVCFNGGKSFIYKDATGITFTISAGGTALSASAAAFALGVDENKYILLRDPSSGRSEMFKITVIGSTTSATVDHAAEHAYTAVAGVWQHTAFSMGSASKTLTANSSANVFAATDVGRLIYVQNAAGGGNVLISRIATYNNGKSVDLEDACAVGGVSGVYATCPAVALDADSAAFGGSAAYGGNTNDFKTSKFHIENFSGVGCILVGQSRQPMYEAKIAALSAPSYQTASLANLWVCGSDSIYQGVLEGNPVGPQGKIYASAVAGLYSCGKLDVVMSDHVPLCTEENNGSGTYRGAISFGDINLVNNVATATVQGMFQNEDVTNPRISFLGTLQVLQGLLYGFPPNVVGGSHQMNGWYEKNDAYDTGVAFTFATPNDQTIAYSVRKCSWYRIGNWVHMEGDIALSTCTYTTASGQAQLTGLPYAPAVDSVGTLSLNGATSLSGSLALFLNAGSTTALMVQSATGTRAVLSTANFPSGNTAVMNFHVSYRV